MSLIVCSLASIQSVAQSSGARHMLTVISEGTPVERPASIPEENHLYLAFNDITAPAQGLTPPSPAHVEQVLAFGRGWDRRHPMIVHCWAGVSRSTAAGYILSHALTPGSDAESLARLLRQRAPWATPNARMIGFADTLLGEDGRMAQAIARIGRGAMAYEGKPFELPVGPPEA
ncbi:MAG: tyrosine phosphatase family protein [Cohaesibacteraceae bacterium]